MLLLAAELSGTHQVVDEPLNDGEIFLAEPCVGMPATSMRGSNGLEIDVWGNSWVFADHLRSIPLSKDHGAYARNRGRFFWGRQVDFLLFGLSFHMTTSTHRLLLTSANHLI